MMQSKIDSKKTRVTCPDCGSVRVYYTSTVEKLKTDYCGSCWQKRKALAAHSDLMKQVAEKSPTQGYREAMLMREVRAHADSLRAVILGNLGPCYNRTKAIKLLSETVRHSQMAIDKGRMKGED
jgi:hypothetical protein